VRLKAHAPCVADRAKHHLLCQFDERRFALGGDRADGPDERRHLSGLEAKRTDSSRWDGFEFRAGDSVISPGRILPALASGTARCERPK
jgi:hypothetical protein